MPDLSIDIGNDLAERARKNRELIGMPSQADILRTGAADYELQAMLGQALSSYPGFAGLGFQAQYGPPQSDRGSLEFYPPWERDNPRQGIPLLEIYDRGLKGQRLSDTLAADMMHYLSAVNPQTGLPIDPQFAAMRRGFATTLTPAQMAVDERAHAQYGDPRPLDQWMEQSRLDAYLRGTMFGQWPAEVFTPEQTQMGVNMRQYLQRSPSQGRMP